MDSGFTLVSIDTPGAVRTGVIASATKDDLMLAGVRADRVDAVKPGTAGLCYCPTLINVHTLAPWVVSKSSWTPGSGSAAERAGCVDAVEPWAAAVSSQCALVHIFTQVVPQLISRRTNNLLQTRKTSHSVNTPLIQLTRVCGEKTLVYIFT